MKKITTIFTLLLVFNSCDDGDVIEENIDFNDATTEKCSENKILYQLKNNSSLLLEMSETNYNAAFVEVVGSRETNIINPTDKLIYRTYDGNVANDNICGSIRPTTPNVTNEWNAQFAKLLVTTTAIREATNDNGQSKILRYRHVMTLENIGWLKQDGTQIIETERLFGYQEIGARALSLAFDENTSLVKNTCSNNTVYSVLGSESMQLKLSAENYNLLFPATSIVGTKSLTLNDANKLTFTLFSSAVTASYFCATTIPSTPTPLESWISQAGNGNITGYIEVKTETVGPVFKYTVTAKNTTLARGTNTLRLKNNQVLGTFLSTN